MPHSRVRGSAPSALSALSLALLILVPCASLAAQTIAVSGDPGPLTVGTATPGAPLDPASDASTTYTVTTTAPGQKIVARLDAPMPAGVTLSILLTAPGGAASAGEVVLSTIDQTVVGSIPTPDSYAGLTITYRLKASTSAGSIPTTAGSVVLTVVPGP
ncbi:MAG TPA: hypothetical protein VF166_02665 [Gemmatimonadaceae bacterium]